MDRKYCRKHNFTISERKVFNNILRKYTSIIENKKTDKVSAHTKNIAWDRIAIEYNGHPLTQLATPKQLRRLWMNCKQRHKEALRQRRMAIGGWNPNIEVKLVPNITDIKIDSAIELDTLETDMLPAELPLSYQGNAKTEIPLPDTFNSIHNGTRIPLLGSQIHPKQTQHTPPSPTLPFQQSNSLASTEYDDRLKRQNELHVLQKELLKEQIREAKAKADLAELVLRQQSNALLQPKLEP